MCYDIKFFTKKKIDYARRFARNEEDLQRLEEDLNKLGERLSAHYHISGFDHPDVPVVLDQDRDHIQLLNWGLIPAWTKDVRSAVEISKRTLNARGEDMFEKPSFKDAARHRRCLIVVDAFYEFHWRNGKSYPHHISLKNDEPIALGGLWETWKDRDSGLTRNTVAIVTTVANKMMAHVHNEPKGSIGPRMPLIIPRDLENDWLDPVEDNVGFERLKSVIAPYPEEEMEAYTVGRLKGKAAVGNVPEAASHVVYPELETSQGELF